ncbi:MAG: type II secretion system F family protein [Gemmataceae bacterium]|nr:type II secretion system F family protein [Gemmataceae bacterium]
MFAARLSTQNLIDLCRVLRHSLSAGLTLRHIFRQQAGGAGPAVRALAGRVLESIEKGESLSAALDAEKGRLSPLFLAMVHVGEQTGHLPEVFHALEDHYLLEQRLRRQVVRQTLWTFIQFVMALLVIAGLIFILGLIGQSRGAAPVRIFGLSGTGGALTFLAATFGSMAAIWLLGRWLMGSPRQSAPVQAVLLRLPALGPALYSLVMGRFAMALHLTLDSGLSIVKGLKLSLQATGNGCFMSKSDGIAHALKNGDTLTNALCQSRLFDAEFVNIVAAAEEAGRVPEMMRHQADYWHEEAARRLGTLARLATFLVWLLYAGFMVYAIFQIAGIYFNTLKI